MSSPRDLPGLSFGLTSDVNKLIDRMSTLDPMSAPSVEPALLDPFLAVGDFINISGPPGCGKSLLAADVILGAVIPQRDGSALGGLLQFNLGLLGGGPVAIIDGENSFARWNSLIRRKMEAEGADPKSAVRAIKYMRPAVLGLQDPRKWEIASIRLAKALAVIRVRFLIADTLGRIWAPEDINSTGWVQRGLVPLRSAFQEYGISALLLSHTKRHQRSNDPPLTGPIGTSFQEGQVDGQIVMSRMKGGRGLTLTHQKSRRSFWIQQGSKVSLQFRPNLGYEPQEGWQRQWPHECPDYAAEDLETEPATISKITSLMTANPSKKWKASEIASELQRHERTIRHHLQALERNGCARKINRGPNTRWRVV